MRTCLPFILVALTLALSSCDGAASGECTEIGCESSIEISYGSTTLSGAYDLTIQLRRGGTLNARCNDPDPAADDENPDGLSCDSRGFRLLGSKADSPGGLSISATTTDGEILIPATEVGIVEDPEVNRPNGPDCPPECFNWSGTLQDIG